MSGIVGQIGARSGTLDSGGLPSAGTVTQSGTTQLDYEEGTFTPTASNGASAISSINSASYIKIGKLVTITCYTGSMTSGDSNQLQWAGLPFTCAANKFAVSAMGVYGANSYTLGYVRVDAGGASVKFFQGDAARSTWLGDSGASHFIFTVAYEIA